jgi:hypothetical protein
MALATSFRQLPGTVLSVEECTRWITTIDALIAAHPFGCGLSQEVRDADLSARMQGIIEQNVGAPVIVSDRWFCQHYGGLPGNTRELGNHMDGTTRLPGSPSGRSCTTLLIYLNADFEGGTTTFMSGPPPDGVAVHSVVPVPGKAVLLRQDAWHCGDLVTSGVKYLLRTDVGTSCEPT